MHPMARRGTAATAASSAAAAAAFIPAARQPRHLAALAALALLVVCLALPGVGDRKPLATPTSPQLANPRCPPVTEARQVGTSRDSTGDRAALVGKAFPGPGSLGEITAMDEIRRRKMRKGPLKDEFPVEEEEEEDDDDFDIDEIRQQWRMRGINRDPEGKTIVITGAGGRTGTLLAKALATRESGVKEVRTVVHSFKSERKLNNNEIYNTYIADIFRTPENLEVPFGEADTLVILTSAMPKIKTRSLLRLAVAKLLRRKGVRPEFRFKQTPEEVDWIGQKNQIDAAKNAGVKHVVLISSMGGTDPSNMLNKIGNGNILLWKRKAEQYLIASGLNYTIIHPGGLTDKPGSFEPISGVDDELLKRPTRSISRADLVKVILNAMYMEDAVGKSFDVISSDQSIDDTSYDWAAFFEGCSHCNYAKPNVDSILAEEKALEARLALPNR